MLNKDFVSRVVNNLKALNKDSHISRRFVLKTGQTKAAFLMAQKMDELSMGREIGLITTISCFPMEEIATKDCGVVEFRLCKDIMKSSCELPGLLFSKTGVSIFRVYSIDGDYTYDYISPREFARRSKRRDVMKNKKFFTVIDKHLYLLNSTSELVDIDYLSTDPMAAKALSTCQNNNDENQNCVSVWDQPFICPDRFLDLVMKDTLQEVAAFGVIPKDENPNMDSNQKSQTTR